ncbi:hypothetical protein CDCA_CDCA13G3632 [Cyanidium caldarium]|uniref:Alanine--tRNA ligase n=1 Tax=Cyanidium caldarium TaxID=2771 RepID=A0AAV9IZ71_CYACA|nr:hypothetical protein CDCA_CDCA13G3632 [Cyanidium caldarium]
MRVRASGKAASDAHTAPATDHSVSSSLSAGQRMSSDEIRSAFLQFYVDRGHRLVPSASLVPDDPTILLTIAGMVPFKPIFLGEREAPQPPRAVSAQKCVRTTDVENVGRTRRHHTFFEMLGNFSFGDYFKRQAMVWAWELLTQVYGLPAERLAVSVFESDDEAYRIWRQVVGVPAHRIARMGESDNFWASGPTGPCGPCSEIYYELVPATGAGGNAVSAEAVDLGDDARFIELYNLVFMEFNRDATGQLTPLAAKNIDTGMGLERLAQVLQGVPNNYETDLIRPIVDEAASLAGCVYDSAAEDARTSLKVIGDHTRAVVHLLADGVRPSNMGRGYVLRRLIRRLVRHGRLVGVDGPFVAEVAEVAIRLAAASGYQQVQRRREEIVRELAAEESRFLSTLLRGEALLEEILQSGMPVVSGTDAFTLYDTYGFPVEMTQEIAGERGLQVDMQAFDQCMAEQRERARGQSAFHGAGDGAASHRHAVRTVAAAVNGESGGTRFVGYDTLEWAPARVLSIVADGHELRSSTALSNSPQTIQLVLDATPFYAEGGGQVADTGELVPTGDTAALLRVQDVQSVDNIWVHTVAWPSPSSSPTEIAVGDTVVARVDAQRRRRIRAHHTATHLLQSALRQVFGADRVAQAGSLVEAARLRFDFTAPRAPTAEELAQVERLVNEWIHESRPLLVQTMPLDEAMRRGAIAMFGEKYDDTVRVVEVPQVSMELCGGTHVENTAQIGLFKVVSEGGISAGVRRIEAMCGPAALTYLNERDQVVRGLMRTLRLTQAAEVLPSVESLAAANKQLHKQVTSMRGELAAAYVAERARTEAINAGPLRAFIARMDESPNAMLWDADALRTAAEHAVQQLGAHSVVLLAAGHPTDDKVMLAAQLGPQAVRDLQLHAGKLVQAAAKICGGGGGGKPHQAQAGGKDVRRLEEALELVRRQVQQAVEEHGG